MRIIALLTLLGFCKALAPIYQSTTTSSNNHISIAKNAIPSRREFVIGGIVGTLIVQIEPAHARGRATLEQSYDRYSPRILAGGTFYSKDLKKAISKSDWAAIKVRAFFIFRRISIYNFLSQDGANIIT